jgi:pullulanase-type alpha-1,6-glucosidase
MFKTFRKIGALVLVLGTLGLAGCGGGSDIESGVQLLACSAPNVPNAQGTACVPPPPIQCAAPTVPDAANENCVVGVNPSLPDPSFFPNEREAVLYYNRAAAGASNTPNDPAYDGWILHTWNNAECNALMPDSVAPDWATGEPITDIDPNYGAYWVLDLIEDYGTCHNFIVHLGDEKDISQADLKAKLREAPDAPAPTEAEARFARMTFTITGEPTVFEFPIISLGERPVQIDGMAAHWIDATTIVWDAPDAVESVKLHYSLSAGIEATLESGLNGTAVDLTAVDLTDTQRAIDPEVTGASAFTGPWTVDDAKAVLKGQAVLGGYDVDGALVAATGVQIANALDSIYTAGEADADEATLGLIYGDDGITVNLWAPTAQSVTLQVYNAEKRLQASHPMTEDPMTGIWSYTGTGMDRMFYRFAMTVFHPVTGDVESYETTDPYSVSLGVNGRFSQFVNLNDADLKPEGWDDYAAPTIANPEDAVIYEGHIRDFSALDASTPEAVRGKFLAFAQEDTAPVNHLEELVAAGVTHFHMLPANDIATIDERSDRTVDLSSTVFELCLLNRRLEICEDESIRQMTLQEVLDSYDPFLDPSAAQALMDQVRNYDQFNWGYDPHHFNAPEGSYATDPDGVARILEMRTMIKALHDMGLRTVLDVVYNHTNASGLSEKSVLDKTVPGYYHRYDTVSGGILRTSCCDDTEDRARMMAKFMEDSLLMWTEEYHFDAFRFDLMGMHSKDTMLALRDAVQAVDPDNYFYGEGWTREDRAAEQANQSNLAGSQIGTFNDRMREDIRQGQFFARNANESDSDDIVDNGAKLDKGDRIKSGMAGTLIDYVLEDQNGISANTSSFGGYAMDPADIINYVSKHDGNTLWDQLQYVLPNDLTIDQRVRAHNMALGLPLMSQGIPFLQFGGDLLRSKSMDRNTYDAGDWFNKTDFTQSSNNWNVGLPLAQDNQGAWSAIGEFVYGADRVATGEHIAFASDVFQELLRIRSASPLFRLTTAEDIKARVGFHNIGTSQQPGIIAMSIDDGTDFADLDENVDAIMVVVNSNYNQASIRVNTATGFTLHDLQAASVDEVVRNASFAEGEGDDEGNGLFTVPAQTIAVFVKDQGYEQGMGLSAFATSGAPDIVPYGANGVFLRGVGGDWGTSNAFTYAGDGIYTTTAALTAGQGESFKVAGEDWGNSGGPNLGMAAGASIEEDALIALESPGNNIEFTPADTASYEFVFDASDLDNTTLLIRKDNPLFGTDIFLRGTPNGWANPPPPEAQMTYDGNKQFSVALDLTVGEAQFKVATADWSTEFAAGSAGDTINVGSTLNIQRGGGNLKANIESAEEYQFTLDLSVPDVPVLGLFKRQFFGDERIYLRGEMFGWSNPSSDEFVYADGVYTYTLDLSPGQQAFKVASADWDTATVNIGANADSDAVSVGVPYQAVAGDNPPNMRLTIPAAGSYTFTITGPNPAEPTITVSQND